MSVELRRRTVFRMNGERAHADNIGNLQCAPQSIQKQSGTNTTALPFAMHGKARQNKKRYRMTRHSLYDALRRVSVPHFTGYDCVVPDNRLVA